MDKSQPKNQIDPNPVKKKRTVKQNKQGESWYMKYMFCCCVENNTPQVTETTEESDESYYNQQKQNGRISLPSIGKDVEAQQYNTNNNVNTENNDQQQNDINLIKQQSDNLAQQQSNNKQQQNQSNIDANNLQQNKSALNMNRDSSNIDQSKFRITQSTKKEYDGSDKDSKTNQEMTVQEMYLYQSDPSKNVGIDQLSKREKMKAKRLLAQWQQEDYPKNEIFVLYDKINKDFVMAKLTEKKIKFNDPNNSSEATNPRESSLGLGNTLFYNFKDQPNVVNLKLAKHIAKRCSDYSLVLDSCCGIGSVLIHLAKQCDFVLGIDYDEKRINNARDNAKRYKFDNIELIQSDIFDINNCKVDLAFVHPSFQNDQVDLLNTSEPNLPKTLNHLYKITKNIILLLPGKTDLSQLPQLFYNFYKNQVIEDLNSYTIEIEQIISNKKVQYYLVYYGECAKFEDNEELQFLQKKLCVNSSLEEFKLQNFLKYLTPLIGVRGIIKYINKAQKNQKLPKNQNQTVVQVFIDLLQDQKIIKRQDIQENLTMIKNKLSSGDLSPQMASMSFNSKFLMNSRDSNDFELAISPQGHKNISPEEERKINKHSYEGIKNSPNYQQTFQSEGIIIGSHYSEFDSPDGEEDDDEDEDEEDNEYKEPNSLQQLNRQELFQKAKSHDNMFMFRKRQGTDQSLDDRHTPYN